MIDESARWVVVMNLVMNLVVVVVAVNECTLRLMARGRLGNSGARDVRGNTCICPVNCCADGHRRRADLRLSVALVRSMLWARGRRGYRRALKNKLSL